MNSSTLTLHTKTQLTHNVWKLQYVCEKSLADQPGQFLLCDCDCEDAKKKRSYSISNSYQLPVTSEQSSETSTPLHVDTSTHAYEFIIKREEHGT